MISQEAVWNEIWPTIEQLIEATLTENESAVAPTLHPRGQAAEMFDLFGPYVFDLLLKTVLGRTNLSVTRAIETEKGKAVHIEYVWPEPGMTDNAYTAADLVAIKMRRYRNEWRIGEINPAAVDLPLTEARAAAILMNSKLLSEADGLPKETWILPVALFGGALQINLRPTGMKDEVERQFLPGMQARGFGILSLLGARRLWRDFRRAVKPSLAKKDLNKDSAPWAAAIEFMANEQAMREQTQAAVAKPYGVSLASLSPHVRQIKETLAIQGIDERYTAVQKEQIVLK